MLFSLVTGNQFTSNVDWKYTTSENKYGDLFIETESKIKLGEGILNYTVIFTSNKTEAVQIQYYPILEVNNMKKQIEDKKTAFLNVNHTLNFEIPLEKGKNMWSIGVDFLNSPDDKIIHTGTFDKFSYDE